jgi:hypothetical protein
MTAEQVTEEWIAERRAALPDEMLRLIAESPGYPKTSYILRPLAQGGLRGLSDDKEAAFYRLVAEGRIEPGFNRGPRKNVQGWYPAGCAERRLKWTDPDLRNALLGLITREPGRSPSYYCRLGLREGGILGAQDRKEKMLQELVAEGAVEMVKLPRQLGRLTVVVQPTGCSRSNGEV